MAIPGDETPPRLAARSVAAQALTLAILGAALSVVLVLIANLTRERITHNEQAWIQQHLDALIAPGSYDNDPLTDTISVTSPQLLGTTQPVRIHRARLGEAPIAAAIRSVAPDGYRGPIEILVAIARDGTLIGVQVIRHDETPGLGDAFAKRDPQWLKHFRGLSLTNPPQQRWTVRRDGGDFDAFTGATITPRAIVKAVRRTLEYYQANQERIFAMSPQQ